MIGLLLSGPEALTPYLVVSAALFACGVLACATRRNAVGYLMGIELMLNAAALDFVAYGRFRTPLEAGQGQIFALFVIATASLARPAYGEEPVAAPAPAQSEADDEPTVLARKEFLEGAALVRAERWGEALAAFERATKLKPHAVTTFNIAQCERAMG